METIKIRIDSINVLTSKAGKTYAKVNDYYTVHEKEILRTFEDNIGKEYFVEVTDSEDGNWHNIRKIAKQGNHKLIKPYAKDIENLEVRKTPQSKEYHLTEGSVRSNALASAVEFCKVDSKVKIQEVTEVAEEFVKFINKYK